MTIEVSDAYEVGDIVTIEMPNGLTECFESGSMSDRPSECEGVSCSETFEDLDTPIS